MTYELARELKDAGFPAYDDMKPLPGPEGGEDWPVSNIVITPTLSELIEACGDRFFSLEKARVLNDNFSTWSCNLDGELYLTPEEAVAKLWLKLSTKNLNEK